MAERVVISRSGRAERLDSRQFRFSRQDSPILSGERIVPAFLKDYHTRAWQAFEELPMPSTNDEPWRRTDLRSFPASTFQLLKNVDLTQSNLPRVPEELLKPLAGEEHGGQMVITAHGTQTFLAPELVEQGVVFCDLRTAEDEHPQILEKILGKVVPADEGKFSALVGALASSGALIHVPRNVEVEQPLHSILWGPGINLAYLSHLLVYIEEGASLTFVHEAASQTEAAGQAMHAGNVEIYVGPRAKLRFVELQSWGEHVWNFSHERVHVDP
ncbi:MAG: SufD family Fe-S cluster assembly protein [Anaerolineales bacterium]|nr:SufD family Fe-S cluster assembly protein [Anaerolineales bacterium]